MSIKISEHFTYEKLFRFTAPSILMLLCASIYSVIDGYFVANFVGETEFAAINLMFPILAIISAIGFMLGAGGSALVAKTFGEGDKVLANKIFSLVVYTTIALGFTFATVTSLSLETIVTKLFGVEGDLLEESLNYGHILLISCTAYMLQVLFQAFMIVAERPKLGLIITIICGVTNIVLDALFILGFGWGLEGAAWATAISEFVGGFFPLIYFALPNSTQLSIGKTKFLKGELLHVCSNGFSELLSNVSVSIVTMLFNYQMLVHVGEKGVVALGVIVYVQYIFLSVFMGYSLGTSSLLSYNYGANDTEELSSLLKKNLVTIGIISILLLFISETFTEFLAGIFVSQDRELVEMTCSGLRIFAISFLIAGFNIYASALFTALNNGFISAVISTVRTLVCECGCILILPLFFGINGVWSSIIVAEGIAVIVSFTLIYKYNERYDYLQYLLPDDEELAGNEA